jgi:hypothetical protein
MTRGESHVSTAKLFGALALFFVVGAPLVAILWKAVNELAAGELSRWIIALPMFVLFVAFLTFFGRWVRRLEQS